MNWEANLLGRLSVEMGLKSNVMMKRQARGLKQAHIPTFKCSRRHTQTSMLQQNTQAEIGTC